MNLFLVFADQDRALQAKLLLHLNLLKDRLSWTIQCSGDESSPYKQQVEPLQQLSSTDVVLLLLSVDFFNDPFIVSHLLPLVIERHKNGDCLMVPVLLRSCLWQETALGSYIQLAGLKPLPNGEIPLITSDYLNLADDKVYVDTVTGIRDAIIQFDEKKKLDRLTLAQLDLQKKKIRASSFVLISVIALSLFYVLNMVSEVPLTQLDSGNMFVFEYPMTYVLGGNFIMGSPENENDRYEDECLHYNKLDSYSIGQYEVTQALWRAVMGSNPSEHKNCDDCPVEAVSWNDIQIFINKLNALTSMKYRLPSEAEWEYAARGGVNCGNISFVYAGNNNPNKVAWYYKAADRRTHPVGQKAPNSLGLFDMSGNVWEFCQNEYKAYPGCRGSGGDARILRGGSWFNDPSSCRVAARSGLSPSRRTLIAGFRLAL
jgi:formylglycine-generating enzyme required for sulfatase activity